VGLTDSHILAIVDGLSTPGNHLNFLNLESNPGICAQGYGALLNLMDRANVVSYGTFNAWHGFVVDDMAWEGKLNLVSEMNLDYRHLEYMMNGTFASKESRLQWLEKVANLPRHLVNNARHLNFFWHTLCVNPEMLQVSQAQTRT
jgi:hypothetical protein